ncbi:MAG: hypothetical protein U5K00_21325 [Melioribacteraceae bacterium]|nr:hypothetical protein [Melioribacteraceae bacterium]
MSNKIILECKHTDQNSAINPQQNKTYLSDDKGNKSLMRLMSFIALISAMIISAVILILDMISLHSVSLVSLFIFGAFAPKALQKFAEVK